MGKTPAELLLGYQPRSIVQNLIQPASVPVSLAPKDMDLLLKYRLARLDACRSEAVDRQLTVWKQRVEKYDSGIRKHVYSVGDWVLYQNYKIAEKFGNPFEPRWFGPVIIIAISSRKKLDLQVPFSHDVLKGWHTDKVKPYMLRNDPILGKSKLRATLSSEGFQKVL
jgi:hypothetical protein